jgi:hypothetical protein
MTCDAKIRPLPDDTELACECDEPGHTNHQGTLRDYAFPGSATTIYWAEGDRRNFRGDWPGVCLSGGAHPCVLPAGHRRGHVR